MISFYLQILLVPLVKAMITMKARVKLNFFFNLYCICYNIAFMFRLFGHEACRILALHRDQTRTPCIGR